MHAALLTQSFTCINGGTFPTCTQARGGYLYDLSDFQTHTSVELVPNVVLAPQLLTLLQIAGITGNTVSDNVVYCNGAGLWIRNLDNRFLVGSSVETDACAVTSSTSPSCSFTRYNAPGDYVATYTLQYIGSLLTSADVDSACLQQSRRRSTCKAAPSTPFFQAVEGQLLTAPIPHLYPFAPAPTPRCSRLCFRPLRQPRMSRLTSFRWRPANSNRPCPRVRARTLYTSV